MNVSSRAYNNELDHSRVLTFLRDLYTETGGLENWLPTRFENNSRSMDPGVHLWFYDEALVGLVVPDSLLLYYVMVHPRYIGLYSEMVTWLTDYSRSNWEGTLKIIEMDGETQREKKYCKNMALLVIGFPVYSGFVTWALLFQISSYLKASG